LNLGWFLAWTVGPGVLQLALEPTNTLACMGLTNLGQVGAVRTFSTFTLSPLRWAALVVCGVPAA
jgi:hypothetical protein